MRRSTLERVRRLDCRLPVTGCSFGISNLGGDHRWLKAVHRFEAAQGVQCLCVAAFTNQRFAESPVGNRRARVCGEGLAIVSDRLFIIAPVVVDAAELSKECGGTRIKFQHLMNLLLRVSRAATLIEQMCRTGKGGDGRLS